MQGQTLFREIAIILAASLPILFICRKLGLPAIFGYLVSGIVIGPHALAFVRDGSRVEQIAELGVILILFFVGLEFPLERLRGLGRSAAVSGGLQMALTVGVVIAVAASAGVATGTAIFYGFLVSISSTAVVIPLIAARGESASPYARRALGVLLFQDLAVIPLILFLPALGSGAQGPGIATVFVQVGIAIAGVIILIAVARFVVPKLLGRVIRLGSRDIVTTTAVVLVIAVVYLAERVGVSAAMGAFAAGVIVADTEYIHEIATALRPFRDLLSSLFFASIGMLFDPLFLIAHPLSVIALVAGVLILKSLVAYPSLRLGPTVPRTAIRAALALATIGEFSFVLAGAGKPFGLLTPAAEQYLIGITVITFAIAPLLLVWGKQFGRRFKARGSRSEERSDEAPLSGHIVVVGYGLNGKNVSRVLSETGLRYLVMDEDPRRLVEARENGHPVLLADASDGESLSTAGVERAAGVVVAISDPDGTRRIVQVARMRNPTVRIIVRTRYVSEVDALRLAGADEVIPEEFETSIEIVTRVLRSLHVPGNIIAAQLRILRDETYKMLRETSGRTTEGRRLSAILTAGTSDTFLVLPDTYAEGKTLDELGLVEQEIAVPALLRDGKPVVSLTPDLRLAAGDTLLLVGAHEDLNRVISMLEKTGDRR